MFLGWNHSINPAFSLILAACLGNTRLPRCKAPAESAGCRHVYPAMVESKRFVMQLKLRWATLSVFQNQCNRRYPCDHCTRRRRPEECVYNSLPVARFPNTLPLVSGDQSQSLEHPQDSREQHSIEDTNTLSLGLYKAKDSLYPPRSTLLESFGYSEDSSSNTIALLKMVSTTTMLYIDPVSWNLTRVPSGIRTA